MEDILVESVQVVADQIRKAESNRLISADENALRWAEQQATMSNPWEILLGHAKRLMGKPSADRAIEYLLNQTYLAEQKLAMHPELPNLSVYLRGVVQDFLSGYDDMSREIAELKRSKQFAEAKELEGGLKGSRPADVYRAYARPLRWWPSTGFQRLIGATLRRLLMDDSCQRASWRTLIGSSPIRATSTRTRRFTSRSASLHRRMANWKRKPRPARRASTPRTVSKAMTPPSPRPKKPGPRSRRTRSSRTSPGSPRSP